jgi:hypothetical protein
MFQQFYFLNISLHISSMLVQLHITTITNNYAKHQVTGHTMVSVVWSATAGVQDSVLTFLQCIENNQINMIKI